MIEENWVSNKFEKKKKFYMKKKKFFSSYSQRNIYQVPWFKVAKNFDDDGFWQIVKGFV